MKAGSATATQNSQPVRPPATSFPKSISVSSMLRVGAVVTDCDPANIVEMSEFNIHKMAWSAPQEMSFQIDENPFAQGGFREVYRAKSSYNQYVVKKFLPSTLETVNKINSAVEHGETVETLCKKSIQAHMLAKNFALQLKGCVREFDLREFGKCFEYNAAKLGRFKSDGPYIMIEDYFGGDFFKYVNNDGNICEGVNEMEEEAECLVHFSYENIRS